MRARCFIWNKLYDALAAGILCLNAGTFPAENGILGRLWTVESSSELGTDYTVGQVTRWDLSSAWGRR